MEKTSLRILHRLALPAAFLLLVACASTQPPSAPKSAPASEPEAAVSEPASPSEQEILAIKPDAPQQYVVVKGDTLWDISSRYLETPWRWPELWEGNPQIANPHLIYPGDTLYLAYKDGRPFLQLQRGGRQEVRLSPQVRVENLGKAIPAIPMSAIRPFLNRPRVMSEEEIKSSAYIISDTEQSLIMGPGYRVYASGIGDAFLTDYSVVRPGEVYRNPDNPKEILGYELIDLGDAQLKEHDEISTLQLKSLNREVLKGDRLLPASRELSETDFLPHAPKQRVKGQIIAVPGGVALFGSYQVVTINLGEQDGIEPGHVLSIYRTGDTVRDPLKHDNWVQMPDRQADPWSLEQFPLEKLDPMVTLPNTHSGTLMVFRSFARVSYALVMKATRTLRVNDTVTNPH